MKYPLSKSNYFLAILFIISFTSKAQSDNELVLQGIMDLSIDGKGIHLFATADIADLSIYGIGVADNGGGSNGQDLTLPMISVSAGDNILLAQTPSAMEAYLGYCYASFEHLLTSGAAIYYNGDDAIELYEFGVVIETYGDIDTDGSGEVWEYLDSWAYKLDGEWTYGEVNCTDASTTILEATCPYPFCPAISDADFGCTDIAATNYNSNAFYDDGSCILSTEFNGYDIFLQPFPRYEPIEWAPYGSSLENIFEDNLGSGNGKQNTEDIVDFYGTEESYAANYCYNLEQHGYSDWYLPSSDELGAFHSYLSSEWDLMDYYSNTEVASGNQIAEQTIGCCFSQPLTSPGIFYWTSNENYPSESATLKKIFENSEWHDNKSNTHPVRCVRNNAVEGCQDEAACNYNYDATLDDNSCEYPEEGFDCNGYALEACPYDIFVEYYSPALSYNPALCQTLIVNGCTNMDAENYNSQANTDDGSCIIYGCTNLQAENYNSQATTDDGSCIIYGCINYTAENYNPQATIEDGSCIVVGCTIEFFPNYNAVATVDDASCSFTSNNIYGCTDILYVEYAPEATIDNGTCTTLLISGCMDIGSCNYNSEANNSDDSCEYPEYGYDCNGNELVFEVGDFAHGGIVFYVDETGSNGLVACPEDLEIIQEAHPFDYGYEWGCSNIGVNTPCSENEFGLPICGDFIGSGKQNTLDIINQNCATDNGGTAAAIACNQLIYNTYNDWYQPSKDELILMYNSILNIGNFLDGYGSLLYWSSSEKNVNQAIAINFQNGDLSVRNKANLERVRAIRSFGTWIEGCMNETACNYNSEATMADDSCEYPQDGYDCDGNLNVQIGDMAFGGIVFYIDEINANGLVVAMEDLEQSNSECGCSNNGYRWGCKENSVDGADGQEIGTGNQNTLDIITQGCENPEGDGITAAEATSTYEDGIFNDWHLPSLNELQEIYNTVGGGGSLGNIVGMIENNYWSSSERNNHEICANADLPDMDEDCSAWTFNFQNGIVDSDRKQYANRVRPIRAFGNWNIVEVFGCTEESAFNYNADANVDDGSCEPIVFGCMDQTAFNWNPAANVDDFSCEPVILGCIYEAAFNYNPSANTYEEGSCIATVYGCTNPTAPNFDPDANTDNGICIDPIVGCTNEFSPNYNADANVDDGSCIAVVLGCTDPEAWNFDILANYDNGTCVAIIYGCTVEGSFNYNINANISDGSCIPTIYGCTDIDYIEYTSSANTSDATMCINLIVEGCMDEDALNYNMEANTFCSACCEYCPDIEIVEAVSDISCLGGNADISITVYPPGFYSFEWSSGQTSSTIFDIPNGIYTITVTDNNGCSNSKDITIESPSEISIEANVIDDDLGQCEGEILPTITGGSGDYTFQWYDNNNQTTQNAIDLCAGSYLLEVTDENGCTASESFQVGGGIPWNYGITSSNHTLFIQDSTIFNLYNSEISFGDYIGAFYMDESTGELKCGGYTIWQEEQVGIPMWGDDQSTEEKDGFYENDRIIIGVYNNSEGREYFGQSVYFDSFPNEEMFSTNGLSSLQEFNGMPSPSWNTENTGQNHVIMLTEFEPFIGEEPLVYGDFIGLFFTDDNGELRCGGKTIWTGENNTIAAWGDDSFTPEKDGFDDGEEFTWIVWKSSEMEAFNTYASYSSNSFNQGNFTINGMSVLLSLYINVNQTLSIPSGWSMISINVALDNYSLTDILYPIIEDVIIAKDYLGNAYLPEFNFNGIGDINNSEGYQIKLQSAQNLPLNGEYIYPENHPLNIPSGWSIISYLRTQPALADQILSDIISNVVIVKNYLGLAYLPEFNYNGIGDMVPGEGYQIKLDETDVLVYLANNMEYRISVIPTVDSNTSWCIAPTTTDNNMTVVIPENAWDKLPGDDAEIIVFDALGQIVGCSKLTYPVTLVSVWGNDEMTSHKDGMYVGEQISFKVFENNICKDLIIEKWSEGSEVYEVNTINVSSSIITQSDGEHSDNVNNKSLVKIINLLGQEVNELTLEIGTILFRVYDDGSVEKFIK